MGELYFRNGEPAQPIALVGATPQRRIFLPQTRDLIIPFPIVQGCGDRAPQLLRQFVGLCIDAHARTPALLPVASSRVLKASAKSLTPSTSSLSVTSFIEMPAFPRSAMVFAAASTFSVRLGRSLPGSRKASNVAGGIVSTVAAPISSST